MGATGEPLVQEGNAELRALGCLRPERMTALLVPIAEGP
jgi:hypothetical protein